MKSLFAFFFAVAFALVAAPMASAQTGTVCTSLLSNGSVTVSDTTELDEAIDCYNTATVPDDYTITLGADITYTAPVDGAMPISQGGSGYGLTIDGDNNKLAGTAQVIQVEGAAPVTLTTIEIEATDARAIDTASGATVTVDNSTVSASDQGIYNVESTMTVTNSSITVSNNFGITNLDGTMTVTNSAITAFALGIQNAGVGLGMMTVENSAITVDAVGILNTRSLGVTNSTITSTSIGILNRSSATLTVKNSTIASTTTGISILNIAATPVTVTSSIVDSSPISCFGPGGFTIGLDSFATGTGCAGASTLSGTLGMMQDNGCVPSRETPAGCTQTRLLSADSNAVDAVVCDAAVLVDQRGFVRPQGAACDAGALELGPTCEGRAITIDMNEGDPGQGTSGVDVILGTPGNDVINGGGGDDIICAGEGVDVIIGGEGNDVINAGPGDDRALGGKDDDTINGDEGNDFIVAGSGIDTIDGGPDNDRCINPIAPPSTSTNCES